MNHITFIVQFFTWNDGTNGCGIREYPFSGIVNAMGQKTGPKTSSSAVDILENKVLVGNALFTADQKSCWKACKNDDKCQSCTFNDHTSPNPNVCVLNYGPTERQLPLGANSGVASAPKEC